MGLCGLLSDLEQRCVLSIVHHNMMPDRLVESRRWSVSMYQGGVAIPANMAISDAMVVSPNRVLQFDD